MAASKPSIRGPLLGGIDVALWVAVVVVGAILFVNERIRYNDVTREIYRAERQAAALRDERTQLTGLIVYRQKPGTIEQIARGRLGMDYAFGRQGHSGPAAPRGGTPQ